MEGPWAVCGDFSICRFPSEKRNCQRRFNAMVEFSDTLEDLELIDLPLEGGTFTCEQFNKVKQSAPQRLTSDHVPITLHCGPWNQNKSYFKFENWWLNTEGFTYKVSSWWKSFAFHVRSDYILAC
ncbi:unnamed protein product [Withania somnifera]